jgi:hypothetical protein
MKADTSGSSKGGFSSAIYLRAEGKGNLRATLSRVQP